MIKRFLPSGCIVLLLYFIAYSTPAQSQDTTKKAAARKTAVKSGVPPKAKPVNHYQRKASTAATTAATQTVKDTSQANSMQSQMDPAQLNDKSLYGQYQYLLTKTYHYQQPLISALWKNMMDTLNLERRQLKDIQAKITSQSKELSDLKADITKKEQTLAESNSKADAISLFGIVLPKSTYNLVMCGLAGGLALALIIVILTTAKYKHEAKYRIELYEEIEEEYKTFKAKANEKELKLARELQTERNKVDELLGRG